MGRPAAILEPSALGLPRGARVGRPGQAGRRAEEGPREGVAAESVAWAAGRQPVPGQCGRGCLAAFWQGAGIFLPYFSNTKQHGSFTAHVE